MYNSSSFRPPAAPVQKSHWQPLSLMPEVQYWSLACALCLQLIAFEHGDGAYINCYTLSTQNIVQT